MVRQYGRAGGSDLEWMQSSAARAPQLLSETLPEVLPLHPIRRGEKADQPSVLGVQRLVDELGFHMRVAEGAVAKTQGTTRSRLGGRHALALLRTVADMHLTAANSAARRSVPRPLQRVARSSEVLGI
jgi:hypothetical protein